jgi:acyl transferase domain-containing protein
VSAEHDSPPQTSIAIVGMACYLPDAATPYQFWRNLVEGRESVRNYSEEALRAAGVSESDLADPAYVRAGVSLEGYDQFDPAFFGLSPREARVMDPQHRKFLECAWSALEDAGHTPGAASGNIAVFAGSGMHWYLIKNVMTRPDLVAEMGEFLVRHTANDKDFLATRVSYHLDLRGPSVNVQTACSTSLVAVHMACQSLLSGECDLALAGGATVDVPHGVGYLYREEEVRSPDGHCRSMDADAGGTVFGSGCGVVVLRRLADALADGDEIRAVIRGSAVNNDGAGKAGYLAPSVDGHAQAVAEAIAVAGVSAETIAYVEAHGTATKIGDPIEVLALTQGFATTRRQYCALGSVKTNIGHLDTAAGVVGLIKIALAMQHRSLPASLHYRSPNPEIDFPATPFYVNARLGDWPDLGAPLRAGISSLGVGGTNVHVVLQEAPTSVRRRHGGALAAPLMFPLSAKTPAALSDAAGNIARHLGETEEVDLPDVAWTLANGRVPMEHRAVVVGRSIGQVRSRLDARFRVVRAAARPPQVVFMFPGQGAQYPGMSRHLYEADAAYRTALDDCFAVFSRLGREDIRRALFPAEGAAEAVAALRSTAITQPALFAVEYALAMSLMSKGVEPVAMIGHSLGEYAAACLAGAFTLDTALRLVCRRGELIASLPGGAMIAVAMPAEAVARHVTGDVSLAAVNGPELTVWSGSFDAIDALFVRLEALGAMPRRLEVSHAFHSHMLDPILEPFAEEVARLPRAAALNCRVMSNLSGRWLTAEQLMSRDYWSKHLRETVDFAAGVQQLGELGPVVFLEVGPGSALGAFVKAGLKDAATLGTLPHPEDRTPSDDFFYTSGGSLWAHGIDIDWTKWGQPSAGRRRALPTYPFQRQRYWLDPGEHAPSSIAPQTAGRAAFDDWFYVTDWHTASPGTAHRALGRVLVFGGANGLGRSLARALAEPAEDVIELEAGSRFESEDGLLCIRPDLAQDWERVVTAAQGCSHIVYAWPADLADDASATAVCFDYLLALVKRLDLFAVQPRLLVVTADAQPLGGKVSPYQALVAGPVRTVAQEVANASACWLDLASRDIQHFPEACVQCIVDEMRCADEASTVAWRSRRRLLPSASRIRLPLQPHPASPGLRTGGTYLITGAFGGAGQVLAEYLSQRYRARIVMVGRQSLPVEGEWDTVIAGRAQGDDIRRRLHLLRRIASFGGTVHAIAADVADQAALTNGLEGLDISRLDGVFHAAGVLDDSLIALKPLDVAHRVLWPKVQGTQAIQALRRFHPRFFVYFSSLSALAGAPGQVDYTAANAYLDAFAADADRVSSDCRHIAVQWSMWRDAGMAAKLAASMGRAPAPPSDADLTCHAVLAWHRHDADGTDHYYGMVTPDSLWYLGQHRLRNGDAVLPGAGYVALIGTAVAGGGAGFVPFELRDVRFHAPLILASREQRLIRVELGPARNGSRAVSVSSAGSSDDDLIEHLTAFVGSPTTTGLPVALPEVPGLVAVPGEYVHPLLVFGTEWDCLEGISAFQGDAEVRLMLRSTGELAATPLHPGLLDMAIGAAQKCLARADAADYLLPAGFERLVMLAPLQAAMSSRTKARSGAANEMRLDVDVYGDSGALLVAARGFSLKATRRASAAPRERSKPSRREHHVLDMGFGSGLANEEAMRIVETILGSFAPSQVSIATRDLDQMLRELRSKPDAARPKEDSEPVAFMPRPDLGTVFAPAHTELQRSLLALWEQALEIRGIGIHDNFFELGGHSLLLTRLISRLRKDRRITLSLESAFEEATVSAWAKLGESGSDVPATALIKRADRSKYKLPPESVP